MSMEEKVKSIQSNTLSNFRTKNFFDNYGEITSLDDYNYYVEWANKNNKDIFILGNGSNTLFTKKRIQTLVLKNKIQRDIKCISQEDYIYEITSSVMMNEVLSFCYKNSLDSFYFLASVPATIGGALAMNAGEGKHINRSIYDFVESVTYIDTDNSVKVVDRKDIHIEFRETMFTGIKDKFIISAVFRFPYKDLSDVNPIKERIKWAKTYQDNTAPNCGSVFNESHNRIMGWLKGLKIKDAEYSSKTHNWIKNKSESPIPVVLLINIARFLHIIFRKKYRVEVIRIK